jgi:hypothetical protein
MTDCPEGHWGDNPAHGYDDPIAALPLDRLDPAEAGKHAAAGDLEDVAVAIFDQCTAAANGMEDPIRQDLLRAFCFGRSRRTFGIVPVVSTAAAAADDAITLFLSFSIRSTVSTI